MLRLADSRALGGDPGGSHPLGLRSCSSCADGHVQSSLRCALNRHRNRTRKNWQPTPKSNPLAHPIQCAEHHTTPARCVHALASRSKRFDRNPNGTPSPTACWSGRWPNGPCTHPTKCAMHGLPCKSPSPSDRCSTGPCCARCRMNLQRAPSVLPAAR